MLIPNSNNPLGSSGELYATFDSETTTPYCVLGRWADYDRVEIDFSSNDSSRSDVLLGRAGNTGFIGYNDGNYLVDLTLGSVISITPQITAAEKGNGIRRTVSVTYTNGVTYNTLTVGAFINPTYTRRKKIYKVRCYKDGILLIDARPRIVGEGAIFYNILTNTQLEQFGLFEYGYA